ncbi:hypothetical protein SAMN02910418_01287 [Bowdeniella nasicola]|uniref:Addiction module antidote protein, HigA family n=1 Tax=Bowdeniella nasicola TaxID=208480 RepID=A0A1H4A0E8_9ACTO|nr:hypothetical protein SAMN02910418_01287 [Bowdeniella nasicola]
MTTCGPLRLGRYFGIEPQYWLNVQSRYALQRAQDRLARELAEIAPLEVA